MLILIAGVSGNLGQYLAKNGLAQGHSIRGFGRTPSKLTPDILDRLESFVQCEHYDDRTALDQAVKGVDAVICTYVSHADAILDSQLPLLRATERAGVKVYHAHSWNADWTKIKFEDWEHYDAYLSFRRQVELTSAVKPVYVFTGILGEFATSEAVGIAYVKANESGQKKMYHWGDGTAKWDFTYLDDAARFSIDLVTTNEDVLAGKGGFFRIHSAAASALDLVAAYEKVKGEKLETESLGGLEELNAKLQDARANQDPRKYFAYANYYLQGVNIKETWKMEDPQVVGNADAVERLFGTAMDIPEGYL